MSKACPHCGLQPGIGYGGTPVCKQPWDGSPEAKPNYPYCLLAPGAGEQNGAAPQAEKPSSSDGQVGSPSVPSLPPAAAAPPDVGEIADVIYMLNDLAIIQEANGADGWARTCRDAARLLSQPKPEPGGDDWVWWDKGDGYAVGPRNVGALAIVFMPDEAIALCKAVNAMRQRLLSSQNVGSKGNDND